MRLIVSNFKTSKKSLGFIPLVVVGFLILVFFGVLILIFYFSMAEIGVYL
jgi:hypothetical protein